MGWDGKSQIGENKAYILSHLVGWEGGYRKRPMPNPGQMDLQVNNKELIT